MLVFSAKTGPLVITKLANLPASRLPTMSETPKRVAGVEVKASNAFCSLKPYCIALRRFGIKLLTSFNPFAVNAKVNPAFSKLDGFVGANSQCFMSAMFTKRASVGSSKSIACGKSKGKMKFAFDAFISSMRWYSLPLALIMYWMPNSSPILSARKTDHLSVTSNICGNVWISLKDAKDKFIPSFAGFDLYQAASKKFWRKSAIEPIKEPG